MVQRFFAFTGRDPRRVDVFVAIFWGLFSFLGDEVGAVPEDLVWILPCYIVASALLYWRRTAPIVTFVGQGLIVLTMTAIDIESPVPLALLCGTYSLAAYVDDRRHSVSLFVSFLVMGVGLTLVIDAPHIGDAVVIVLLLSIAWVIGDSLRTRRAYQQSLLDRAERAEALRDSLALQAVAEERTRIARELHDVVAHSMSIMVVQAGAARRVVDRDPAAAASAIESIETVGRNSLDEMRRILGVLRGDDNADDRDPQPDIASIEALADEYRSAGLPVAIEHTGAQRPLPPTLELTAYRIVQESLTNTLKHGGGAKAEVTLHYTNDSLAITVVDNGTAPTAARTDGSQSSQKGLIGMRERVAAFDGNFEAGPRLSGGYRVAAVLPLESETASTP